MHFDSVEHILTQLEKQPGWEKFRHHRQLLKVWHNTVSENTAKHTRPLYVNRQVLWVATNSASRAQELSFQRYALLKRLNQQLPFVLKDIRFSASGLKQTQNAEETRKILFTISPENQFLKSKDNLRSLAIAEQKIDDDKNKNNLSVKAKVAAKRWLETIDRSSQSSSLSLCPICNASTPIKEIERWNCCYLCIAQKWSKKYRSPDFPNSK